MDTGWPLGLFLNAQCSRKTWFLAQLFFGLYNQWMLTLDFIFLTCKMSIDHETLHVTYFRKYNRERECHGIHLSYPSLFLQFIGILNNTISTGDEAQYFDL